jgi:hypothetical protein
MDRDTKVSAYIYSLGVTCLSFKTRVGVSLHLRLYSVVWSLHFTVEEHQI